MAWQRRGHNGLNAVIALAITRRTAGSHESPEPGWSPKFLEEKRSTIIINAISRAVAGSGQRTFLASSRTCARICDAYGFDQEQVSFDGAASIRSSTSKRCRCSRSALQSAIRWGTFDKVDHALQMATPPVVRPGHENVREVYGAAFLGEVIARWEHHRC